MKILLSLLFYALVYLSGFGAEIPEADLGAFHRPNSENVKSFAGQRARGVVREIANASSFEKWKVFTDDNISFIYPDHPDIKVEPKVDENIPIEGSPVSTADNSFSKAYHITADGVTLLVILLNDADWLDDGICFCGAIAYQRYLVKNGNLYRFSFLSNGVLKKSQMLGKRRRAMMFEWTHLPLHPDVYRKIARSLAFKQVGPWTEDSAKKRIAEKYDVMGQLGWINLGDKLSDIEPALGKPTHVDADGTALWQRPKVEDGYKWTNSITLSFKSGKLIRFDQNYYQSGWEEREAIENGIPWMLEQAMPYEEPPVIGENANVMPSDLKEKLLALFLEKSETTDDFNSLCQVMQVLVIQGVRDKRALDIVRKRFIKDGDHFAAWVLHEAGFTEDVTLFVQKVKEVYRKGAANVSEDLGLTDLYNWISFIPDEDERYPDLIRKGLSSPNESVREDVYSFLDNAPLPRDEKATWAHAGLKEKSQWIRYCSADLFTEYPPTAEDQALLKKALENEQVEENKEKIKEALGNKNQEK